LDPTRPITAAIAVGVGEDRAAKHLDIISFNRYNGWYSNPGQLSMIRDNVVGEAQAWHDKHKKLVLMAEYGSDTVEGLHIVSKLSLPKQVAISF
jgi:beta-glucuronidase